MDLNRDSRGARPPARGPSRGPGSLTSGEQPCAEVGVERGPAHVRVPGDRLSSQERWFASFILERQRTHRTTARGRIESADCAMGLTSPTGSLVCAHARHPRSMRGWPRCCSPAAKVPQVECTGDDDAEDEKHLYEDHEPVPMSGELNSQENHHPERKGHTQWEPLRLRYSLHSWYRLPVRLRLWAWSLSPSRAAVTAPGAPGRRTYLRCGCSGRPATIHSIPPKMLVNTSSRTQTWRPRDQPNHPQGWPSSDLRIRVPGHRCATADRLCLCILLRHACGHRFSYDGGAEPGRPGQATAAHRVGCLLRRNGAAELQQARALGWTRRVQNCTAGTHGPMHLPAASNVWGEKMSIDHVLAVVPVADLDIAGAWYQRLLGRAPDNRPMETLIEWNVTGSGWIQVTRDARRAGSTLLNLAVSELGQHVAGLSAKGLDPGPIQTVNKDVQLCALSDPDGNTITLIGNFRTVYE